MKFKLDKNEIKELIKKQGACIVSNEILIDGKKVGYMYREEPSMSYNDTGWRFFSGEESQEYCDNAENFNIVELNTLCNYDQSVIKKLDAEISALSTEYDTVKNLISKSIEKTFAMFQN